MNLRYIVSRVNDWAQWRLKAEGTEGYCLSQLQAAGHASPGPVIPAFVMNREVSEVDRSIRGMPKNLRTLIEHKHLEGIGSDLERAKAYCAHHNGLSLSTYYRREKDAYWYIGGCLSTMREQP